MRIFFSALLVGALLTVGVAQRPAQAAMPSFAGYFSGTWTCTSQAGSHIVKAYGASQAGDALLLWNGVVSAKGFAYDIDESYSQHGTAISVVSTLAPGYVYVGSSSGFAGNKLAFSGRLAGPRGIEFQRMTYTRIDRTHFTRTFVNAPTAGATGTLSSSETCTRLSSDPVPMASPQ